MSYQQHLLIIDPQNDFCDLPSSEGSLQADRQVPLPALPVAGAHDDMLRIAAFIDQADSALTHITITLDTHHYLDIAHPPFWIQGDGRDVSPFTQIRADDVRTGKYLPRQLSAQARVIDYLQKLEAAGRYTHMIWPVHCEIGTWGNNVHPAVLAAYHRWEIKNARSVQKVIKGMNRWTEHYSAIEAEVPDASDTSTMRNEAFIASQRQADRLFIAGEASSHCVKSTIEHLTTGMDKAACNRLVLLTDCMSPVKGFERQAADFIESMREKGVQTAQSAEAYAKIVGERP